MPSLPPLPHVFPFRFVSRTLERSPEYSGKVSADWTSNGSLARVAFPATLLPEMLAQAALLIQGGDPEIGRTGFLAGISDFSIERTPMAGDRLVIEVRMAGQFAGTVKFSGVIRRDDGQPVATGSITVKQGLTRPENPAT